MAGTGQPIHAATRCVALLNTDLHWVLSVREADGEPKAGDEHVVLCGRGPKWAVCYSHPKFQTNIKALSLRVHANPGSLGNWVPQKE